MPINRKEEAYRVRVEAAELARSRSHPEHRANPDEHRYASANYAMSFTKGLQHSCATGLVVDRKHFEAFRKAINEAMIDPFTLNVPVASMEEGETRRKWEAPTAGVVYDLQGPDAQAVTMAPAPELGSDELAYEMAEVYELALLRDVPLTEFFCKTKQKGDVTKSVCRLNKLAYKPAKQACGSGRPRKTNAKGEITAQTAFRGSSPGVEIGPYLSQFLLIGTVNQPNANQVANGKITYGALTINQRVPVAKTDNYMTEFETWLKVQNGVDTQNDSELFENGDRRFISTPRDLATYVHYDALYEAYLNACLILLGMKAPFDPAFGNLSGQGTLFVNHPCQNPLTYERHAGGFALYGGPHILTLVTEVATRALKAVRYQKFNNHLRLRPEALAARIEKANAIECAFPSIGKPFTGLADAIQKTVRAIRQFNTSRTTLLPMAFQEGSPMHPSYGAGHATVAGACVTVLKAFFDTSAVFAKPNSNGEPVFKYYEKGDKPAVFTPNVACENVEGKPQPLGTTLIDRGCNCKCNCKCKIFLTLEGELNKLAANISIGRNMAGVHYFSDYYDSLRMGETIAIGLLEEQALCYPTDPFILTLSTFDGEEIRIGAR